MVLSLLRRIGRLTWVPQPYKRFVVSNPPPPRLRKIHKLASLEADA